MQPAELAVFCEKNNLDVHITTFLYRTDLGDEQQVKSHFKSYGLSALNFQLISFDGSQPITLEPGQTAIIGVQNADNTEGHYLASDDSALIANISPGGAPELRKYLDKGFRVSDILVFEKNEERPKT